MGVRLKCLIQLVSIPDEILESARQKIASYMYQEFDKVTRAKFQQTLIEISMAIFPGYFKELY